MFAKFSSVVVLALAAFVAAVPYGDDYSSKCNGGSVQCCNTTQDVNDFGVTKAAGLVGVAVSSLTGQVGLNCNPITGAIGGASGSACSTQTVCCEHYNSAQLIGVNCSPVAGQL